MPHSAPISKSSFEHLVDERGRHAPSMLKNAIMSSAATAESGQSEVRSAFPARTISPPSSLGAPPNPVVAHALQSISNGQIDSYNSSSTVSDASATSTANSSPRLVPMRSVSGASTPRTRKPPTTLNVPGMTSSKVSPDGRIADRDVASKLVIVMVGLPARGKSYITKKIVRYLRWQQHNAEIFNVGNRRRLAAGTQPTKPAPMDNHTRAAHILLNGADPADADGNLLGEPAIQDDKKSADASETIEQDAEFFNPKNEEAARIREQVALSTLEEALDYLLHQGGSVAILDATNSTLERRELLYKHIRRAEPNLGIVFIESVCTDEKILKQNMWLKLSGPDYVGKDREKSFADFQKRVAAYETAYVPLGQYEEDNDMPYIKMIDVGRKIITYQCKSFLTSNLSHYLNTFNLAPRQIWITRHGESEDNLSGRLGGDSELTPAGKEYGRVLKEFVSMKRDQWLIEQKSKVLSSTNFPPQPGDITPPYPGARLGELDEKNFCVWTSTLRRSIQTSEAFQEDEDYDCKKWKDLDELNAGDFEGSTYAKIKEQFPEEFEKRAIDKLHYKYPGVGGEGYLQVIARLRDMVREIERIKDHVLVIGHQSICRVLMAYFMDIERERVADLSVPLGDLFVIEPKPYGHEFHTYRYNAETKWFDEVPDWKPEKVAGKADSI